MKSQSNWDSNPDRSSRHQSESEKLIRKQIRSIHGQKYGESLNLHILFRNSRQYASETTPNGLLAYKWSWKVDSRLDFIAFRWETHSLIECARWSRLPGVVGDGPAGHVSKFYFPNCTCGKLQTKSSRSANWKRNRNVDRELREQRLYRVPIRNVTETSIENCAEREF